MSNLTEKFDELQTDLDTKHGALMDKLDEIIAALDNGADYTGALADILSEVQGFRSDAGTALATIAAGTDRIEGLADDAALIRTDVAAILEALGGLAPDNTAILAALDEVITWIQGVASAVNSGNTALATLVTYTGDIHNTIGLKPAEDPDNLYTGMLATNYKLDLLIQAIGVYGAAPAGTVLAYLDTIASFAPCMCGEVGPNPLQCTAPYNSEGAVILPWGLISGSDVLIASFPDPAPSGIIFGATFGFTVDRTELISADWSQWKVYVESDQANYADGQPGFEFVRYPTNQWRQLDGDNSRAFAVEGRGWIKVHLCPVASFVDNPIGIGDCLSEVASDESNGHWSVTLNELPGEYSFIADDNYYAYPAVGGFIGPNSANVPVNISTLGTQPVVIEFGAGPPDPAPTFQICNPDSGPG